MKFSAILRTLWLFVLTRVLLVIVTYVGYILLNTPRDSTQAVKLEDMLMVWARWDALNFLRIAQHGYQVPTDFAFFPFFPLLIASISQYLGPWSYWLVGFVLSNLALFGTLLLLYQLAADIGGEKVACKAQLLFCIFPTSFYFFTAYNETLFLFFALGTLLALRRHHWWTAGLLGCLAALTRSVGLMLVFPFLVELWLQKDRVAINKRTLFFCLLPMLLIPLGTALYSLYCWYSTGDPIIFATVQENWSRRSAWPWAGIASAIYDLIWEQPFGSFYQAHILLDLGATLSFLALLLAGWRRIRLSYSIYNLILLLFCLVNPSLTHADPLISMQRLVLEEAPAFITLGFLCIEHPRLDKALQVFFAALLVTLSMIFYMNSWMV
uniref:Glycosyltransferase RgtA/B/C/D-like domain-containing protein n=1 Tax=Thermosporothrix sp. COM3 TaxID=2490863 RepID=A0A455SIK6_9CHLR|nr:hypothetical protein KTC_30340 [Thermosporothrix sp. COM3]